jgi:hypothetical protein
LMLAVSRLWQHENVVAGRWRGNDFCQAERGEILANVKEGTCPIRGRVPSGGTR